MKSSFAIFRLLSRKAEWTASELNINKELTSGKLYWRDTYRFGSNMILICLLSGKDGYRDLDKYLER